MARQRGALLISSSGPGGELADGCQLDASEAWPAWCAPGSMVGRSCHSPAELARAAAEGCRWATLSPVFASCSKPAYGPPLGLGALAGSPLPTWALGGVGAPNAARCLRAGAAGIAVMGAVMGADDPARAVAGILGRIEKMAV
jgi:thiamine monophosphate synthase